MVVVVLTSFLGYLGFAIKELTRPPVVFPLLTVYLTDTVDVLSLREVPSGQEERYLKVLTAWAEQQGLPVTSHTTAKNEVLLRGHYGQRLAWNHSSLLIKLDGLPPISAARVQVSALVQVQTEGLAPALSTRAGWHYLTYVFDGTAPVGQIDLDMRVSAAVIWGFGLWVGFLFVGGWLLARLLASLYMASAVADKTRLSLFILSSYAPAVLFLASLILQGYLYMWLQLAGFAWTWTLVVAVELLLLIIPPRPLFKLQTPEAKQIRATSPFVLALMVIPQGTYFTLRFGLVAMQSLLGWSPALGFQIALDALILALSWALGALLFPVVTRSSVVPATLPSRYFAEWIVVPTGEVGPANAMVIGDSKPARYYRPASCESVHGRVGCLAHEEGHVARGHLWKLTLVYLGCCSAMVGLTSLAARRLGLDIGSMLHLTLPVALWSGFLGIARWLGRRFELEADASACKVPEVGLHLVNALRTINHLNGHSGDAADPLFGTHPATETRIRRIQTLCHTTRNW